MIGETTNPKRISVAELFAGYPLAYKECVVATAMFVLFNFASWVGATISEPLYARWLDVCRPLVDAVAEVVPAIDAATAYLETHSAAYMIPAVRNVLSLNFSLLLLSSCCFLIATSIDLFRDPERALNNFDAVSMKLKIPTEQVLVRCVLFLLLFFLPFYFDLGSVADPWAASFTMTMAGYVTMFAANGLCVLLTIYFGVSLAAQKLCTPSSP
jgi:hypothetical protein